MSWSDPDDLGGATMAWSAARRADGFEAAMRQFIERQAIRLCVCAVGLLSAGVAQAADQPGPGPIPVPEPISVPEPPVVAMLISAGMVGGFFYLRQKRKQLAAERRRGKYGDDS